MLSTNQSTRLLNASTNRRFLGIFGSSDVGDTMKAARDVGLLKTGTGVFKRSGDVGGKDLDFYKFKLDTTSPFSARLINNDSRRDRDPISLTILNSAGNTVTGIDGRSLDRRNIRAGAMGILSTSLPAGTYYVRLESVQGRNQNYRLRLAASALTENV
ncbi:MAG: hypothetical protein MUF49_08685 [Oculatellaceae cyanobacterium Prado106]|jgi:hypothetical protein|nr:hypothetical protein [Oculatellaceae cyanobacterium Prado106]